MFEFDNPYLVYLASRGPWAAGGGRHSGAWCSPGVDSPSSRESRSSSSRQHPGDGIYSGPSYTSPPTATVKISILTRATHLPVNADRLVAQGQGFVSEGAVSSSGAGAVVVKITVLTRQNLRLLHLAQLTLKMLECSCMQAVTKSADSCAAVCAVVVSTYSSSPHYTTHYTLIVHCVLHSTTRDTHEKYL